MIACVVSINERVFHSVFSPHVGDNVGVVINVRKEIKKFGKKKEETELHRLQQTILYILLAELVDRSRKQNRPGTCATHIREG